MLRKRKKKRNESKGMGEVTRAGGELIEDRQKGKKEKGEKRRTCDNLESNDAGGNRSIGNKGRMKVKRKCKVNENE